MLAMQPFVWLVLAWVGGIAAILGSLMTIASLLFWLIPPQTARARRSESSPAATAAQPWLQRLKLTGVALTLTLAGVALLLAVPFPLK